MGERITNARRYLFLRRRDLLPLSQWSDLRGYGKHASLRILRACADRAGAFELSASISHAADVRAGVRHRGSRVDQCGGVKRTGLVRLEFHPGQLGCVDEDENKSRHYRGRASRFDGGLSL